MDIGPFFTEKTERTFDEFLLLELLLSFKYKGFLFIFWSLLGTNYDLESLLKETKASVGLFKL